jgi:hypothetical protein
MLFPNGKKLEAYLNSAKSEKYTMPTSHNPFMNVLLTEIGDNPDMSTTQISGIGLVSNHSTRKLVIFAPCELEGILKATLIVEDESNTE